MSLAKNSQATSSSCDKCLAQKLSNSSTLKCARHLSQLDEVACEFFASDTVHAAIGEKVEALYPEHETKYFIELFWSRVQKWRQVEGAGS